MTKFEPPVEIPADLLAWMRQQSQSEFVGSMLRLYLRNGGVSQNQLSMLRTQQTSLPQTQTR